MELFFLGLIIGEIISDYISPILQAFGEEILLRIERRKTCILNDIKISCFESEQNNTLKYIIEEIILKLNGRRNCIG